MTAARAREARHFSASASTLSSSAPASALSSSAPAFATLLPPVEVGDRAPARGEGRPQRHRRESMQHRAIGSERSSFDDSSPGAPPLALLSRRRIRPTCCRHRWPPHPFRVSCWRRQVWMSTLQASKATVHAYFGFWVLSTVGDSLRCSTP